MQSRFLSHPVDPPREFSATPKAIVVDVGRPTKGMKLCRRPPTASWPEAGCYDRLRRLLPYLHRPRQVWSFRQLMNASFFPSSSDVLCGPRDGAHSPPSSPISSPKRYRPRFSRRDMQSLTIRQIVVILGTYLREKQAELTDLEHFSMASGAEYAFLSRVLKPCSTSIYDGQRYFSALCVPCSVGWKQTPR